MDAFGRLWPPEKWQRYVLDLLFCHHGMENFQRVPDRDRGDLGIEAFSLDGSAHQCYAAEEPLSTAARYEKQRDKLSADVRKLIQNSSGFQKLLGRTRLRRWIFWVPRHDSKDLIEHAHRKAAEVRKAGLSYIADDFEIVIHDAAAFPVERNQLIASGAQQLQLELAPASQEQIQNWSASNDRLVQTLNRKLNKVPGLTHSVLVDFGQRLIGNYIVGLNAMDKIRELSPDAYERVLRIKQAKEKTLEFSSQLDSRPNQVRLNEALSEYATALEKEGAVGSEKLRVDLAFEAVADWLFRCPLDFPPLAVTDGQ